MFFSEVFGGMESAWNTTYIQNRNLSKKSTHSIHCFFLSLWNAHILSRYQNTEWFIIPSPAKKKQKKDKNNTKQWCFLNHRLCHTNKLPSLITQKSSKLAYVPVVHEPCQLPLGEDGYRRIAFWTRTFSGRSPAERVFLHVGGCLPLGLRKTALDYVLASDQRQVWTIANCSFSLHLSISPEIPQDSTFMNFTLARRFRASKNWYQATLLKIPFCLARKQKAPVPSNQKTWNYIKDGLVCWCWSSPHRLWSVGSCSLQQATIQNMQISHFSLKGWQSKAFGKWSNETRSTFL